MNPSRECGGHLLRASEERDLQREPLERASTVLHVLPLPRQTRHQRRQEAHRLAAAMDRRSRARGDDLLLRARARRHGRRDRPHGAWRVQAPPSRGETARRGLETGLLEQNAAPRRSPATSRAAGSRGTRPRASNRSVGVRVEPESRPTRGATSRRPPSRHHFSRLSPRAGLVDFFPRTCD